MLHDAIGSLAAHAWHGCVLLYCPKLSKQVEIQHVSVVCCLDSLFAVAASRGIVRQQDASLASYGYSRQPLHLSCSAGAACLCTYHASSLSGFAARFRSTADCAYAVAGLLQMLAMVTFWLVK